ncbi:MAG: UPF0236 family protein [Peptococcaceae bacterium MAG4]|nr:UPF0236 family protein [Peptococcaceae bacterium MAG4]
MEIIRSLNPILLSIIELVIKNLVEMNFSEFQDQLADKLNETGREITRQVLEEMDRKLKKKELNVGVGRYGQRDRKEIVTRFGPVTYHRTYYQIKTQKNMPICR